MDIGSTQNMGGHGYQIISGDGLLFIMADGTMMIITVGFGCLIMNGDPHGSLGEVETDIMVGHR